MNNIPPILAADIGGTNARFALAYADGNQKIIIDRLQILSTSDHDSLHQALATLHGDEVEMLSPREITSRFRERFENKGRLTYVKDIPTLQIMEPQPVLVGAAAYIQGQFF